MSLCDANLYHDNNNLQQETAKVCIEKYGRKFFLKDHNKIMDIGCGDGTVTNMLKKYLPKHVTIVGSDIDDGMVQVANKHYGDENMSFKVFDMTGDFPDEMKGTFSTVFSFCAINWVTDHESTFKNIYNLLEPNGECFLCIVTRSPVYNVYRKLTCNSKWRSMVYDVEKYISPYHDSQESEKEVTVLMEHIGFNDISTVTDRIGYTFPNMKSLKDTLIAICPFNIPDSLMDDFWEDYMYELRLTKGDGGALEDITYYHKILVVQARKREVYEK